MNCQNCGTQIPEGESVCPSCKTSPESLEYKGHHKNEAQLIKDVSDLFVSPNEHQIAISRCDNLIKTGQREKGFCILTDSRLYHGGKYFRLAKWMLFRTYEESIVELQDITASGFVSKRNLILQVLAVFLTLIELLLLIIGVISTESGLIILDVGEITIVLGSWLFTLLVGVITIALWALYIFLKRRIIYQISHAGGIISITVSADKMEQFRDFDRKLHQAKDVKVRELLAKGTVLSEK